MPPPTPVPSVSTTRSVTPRPAPRRHSASAIALPSFSSPTGMPKRSRSRRARSSDSSGRLIARCAIPVFRSMFIGTPTPIAPAPSASSSSSSASSSTRSASWLDVGVWTSIVRPTVPSRASVPARIFVPPTSTPMTRSAATARLPYPASCPLRRSRTGSTGAAGPRGGCHSLATTSPSRTRPAGRRHACRARHDAAASAAEEALDRPRPRAPARARGRLGASRATSRSRTGVSQANERVPTGVRRQLTASDGLLVSNPTTILVLGTDGGSTSGREGANRSDSIMLIRTDPGKRRLAFLSIPRDLQVEIPEVGVAKINAANQIGGPALALRTVERLTGIDVNHVAFVDFDRFRELIDAVGGIDVVVARPIRSNRFDCPYATAQRCAQWHGWRFERGNAAHGRATSARLLAHPTEPARPVRDRLRAGTTAAAGRSGDPRQGHERRHRAPPAVRRRGPRRAARDRPQRLAADAARLGLLPRRHAAMRSTAGSAATRPRSAANPSSSGPRTMSPRSPCSRGARPRCPRRAACRTRRDASSASGRRELRLRRLGLRVGLRRGRLGLAAAPSDDDAPVSLSFAPLREPRP